jgi:hypothetical protein
MVRFAYDEYIRLLMQFVFVKVLAGEGSASVPA